MPNVLVHTADESVTLSAQAVRRLLERGDGDAALLYLALLRHHGTVAPRSLAGELRWERSRIEAAEETLRALGLIAPAAIPEPADERPDYQQGDIARLLESSAEFRGLVAEVERRLGKKLTTPDVGVLLGLTDYLGLPTDVVYLLVCHCAERVQRRYGEGRRPTLRQIEKEGYHWAQLGIFDQTAAAAYLKKWAQREEKSAAYMRALHLPQRQMVDAERRYITQWMDMGFPPETVALAYERTVFYKKDLNWRYLNGILRRWHEAGWHTVHQVEQGEQGGRTSPAKPAAPAGDKDAWMRRYIKR